MNHTNNRSDLFLMEIGSTFAEIEAREESLRMLVKRTHDELNQWYRNTELCARLPLFGPFFGFHAGLCDMGWYRGWRYFLLRLCLFGMWNLVLRGRPGGNDFLICRWMISRCCSDADMLFSRLSIPGPIGETCCWALNSLCLQYQEFRQQFGPRLRDAGLIAQEVEAML